MNYNGEVLVMVIECVNDEVCFGWRGLLLGMFGYSFAVRDELRGFLTSSSFCDFGGLNVCVV